MTENSASVRQIIWRDVFPWLILVRVFRVAIAVGPLMLATAGLAACALGWWLSGFLFLSKEEFRSTPGPLLLARPYLVHKLPLVQVPDAVSVYMPPDEGAALPYWQLTRPVTQMFHFQTPPRLVMYYLVGFLISVAVWALVGGVITRQALVELGCEQAYDWLDAARFVWPRYWQYFLAPIAPLLALVVMGMLVVPAGWLMNADFGVLLAGLAWILVIALGLMAAWLIVGLVFGWPLMFGVIGSKRDGDALQAFSDSFSYVYGKPLHYLWYAAVALTLGGLALYVVNLFASTAVEFGYWGASWGAGAQRIAAIRRDVEIVRAGGEIARATTYEGGVEIIALLLNLMQMIKLAAAYSYFFVSSAAIFLLMRYAVDEKEMDEVHLEEEAEHLETARRAMLSDEAPAGTPGKEPAAKEPPAATSLAPAATVAFDTAAPPEVPPAVSTPPETPETSVDTASASTPPPIPQPPKSAADDVAE